MPKEAGFSSLGGMSEREEDNITRQEAGNEDDTHDSGSGIGKVSG